MTNLTVVIWSAGTPSPPTISIRILLKSNNILFCKMLLENYKNKPIKGAAIAQWILLWSRVRIPSTPSIVLY